MRKVNKSAVGLALLAAAAMWTGCGEGGSGEGGAPDVAEAGQPDATSDAPGVAGDKGDWTVLIYMAADNDLEAFALRDLEELARVGGGAGVRWLVQLDRAPDDPGDARYTDAALLGVAAWQGAKRLEITPGAAVELEDLGEVDMGRPETLRDFLAWGVAEAPAARTAVILWNHGGAWPAFGWDQTDGGVLSLADIKSGLADGAAAAGLDHVDLLGFDACLMGSVEAMLELASIAEVYVASEETQPGHGWDYAATASALLAEPAMDARALGEAIAASYRLHGASVSPAQAAGLTLSVVDLQALEDLAAAVEPVAAAMSEMLADPEGALALGRVRAAVEEYGNGPEKAEAVGVVDLGHLLTLLEAERPDLGPVAGAAREALDAAVVAVVGGPARPNASGASVFFPRLDDPRAAAYASTAWVSRAGWSAALEAWRGWVDADETAPQLAGFTLSEAETSVTLRGTITSADTAVALAMFGRWIEGTDAMALLGAIELDWGPGGALEATLEDAWPRLVVGGEVLVVPLLERGHFTDDAGQACAQLLTKVDYRAGGEWQEATLRFYRCGDDYAFGGAYARSGDTVAELLLTAGAEVRPRQLRVSDASEGLEYAWEPDAAVAVLDEEGLGLVEMPVPPAVYWLGFLVEDFAGNEGGDYGEVDATR